MFVDKVRDVGLWANHLKLVLPFLLFEPSTEKVAVGTPLLVTHLVMAFLDVDDRDNVLLTEPVTH